MSDHALIIGKFYPPHAGHHFLIDLAASECRTVTVLVLGHPREEASLTRADRVDLLRARHSTRRITIEAVVCDLPVDYESRQATRDHAKVIANALGWYQQRGVDVVYGSEPYIHDLAYDLANRHLMHPVEARMVDQARTAFPVRASELRKDLAAGWKWLAPDTKAHFVKRVVVCGAESSGTTTLSRSLAERFQTVWVPEWGRTFSEAVGISHVWDTGDFAVIAEEHERMAKMLARISGPLMFLDTDAWATAMFHALYLQKAAGPAVWDLAYTQEVNSTYLITDETGVPFEDDGYRLFESQREWATRWLQGQLPHATLISGRPAERLDTAASIAHAEARWAFEAAGDE